MKLLVLVPHHEARLPLRYWSASLFSAGLPGAWSFPWLAPLACLNRSLSPDELKRLALTLRQQINENGGKFITGSPALTAFPGIDPGSKTLSIFGLKLNIDLSGIFNKPDNNALKVLFSPPLIGAGILYGTLPEYLPTPPEVSFRAAALANMSLRPLSQDKGGQDNYSFEWRIGQLHWLPKKHSCEIRAAPKNHGENDENNGKNSKSMLK